MSVRIIILAIISAFGFLGYPQNTTEPAPTDISINYFYTDELTYKKINITENKLIYTYFKDTTGKCRGWFASRPCWTENDLKTEKGILSKTEINDLVDLIKQTKFMELEENYGGDPRERHYPVRLSVKLGEKEKSVTYRSSLDAAPEPEAFETVKNALVKLAE